MGLECGCLRRGFWKEKGLSTGDRVWCSLVFEHPNIYFQLTWLTGLILKYFQLFYNFWPIISLNLGDSCKYPVNIFLWTLFGGMPRKILWQKIGIHITVTNIIYFTVLLLHWYCLCSVVRVAFLFYMSEECIEGLS